MPTAVIEVEGLHKDYRRFRRPPSRAVNGLDLSVPSGGVFGFLGPNGSGKTTTIRCLLGLVRPSSGGLSLLGADPRRSLASVIGRVGSMVETPAHFPGFTGRRNLTLLARTLGIGPRRVDAVLEQVGLGERADDRFKTYSLGMKQRLGLGAALLRDPELLILDEPANGLDPAGIKEIRELLRALGTEGRTVFVSSHQLAEVQQICDHVAILGQGKCITTGAVSEVLAQGHRANLVVRVPGSDRDRALSVLAGAGLEASVAGDVVHVVAGVAQAGAVNQVLAEAGIFLTELRPEVVDLETVFLELTSGEGLAP
ncbi:MAG: type transport system ATP-binding protein [Actinomycetota bacterium]|jgi:ABC-2 type transport system ATP-binding protein|nr:type transport system ATP-binding protein [Actinomycetota bacterium]